MPFFMDFKYFACGGFVNPYITFRGILHNQPEMKKMFPTLSVSKIQKCWVLNIVAYSAKLYLFEKGSSTANYPAQKLC
jgi:hypothetical protein